MKRRYRVFVKIYTDTYDKKRNNKKDKDIGLECVSTIDRDDLSEGRRHGDVYDPRSR